jgi:hypothetical protein
MTTESNWYLGFPPNTASESLQAKIEAALQWEQALAERARFEVLDTEDMKCWNSLRHSGEGSKMREESS